MSKWSLRMLLPNGTVLANRNDANSTKKIDSYSGMEEEYTFCVENRETPAVFTVKFYQGLEVKRLLVQLADLQTLAKANDTTILKAVVDQVL